MLLFNFKSYDNEDKTYKNIPYFLLNFDWMFFRFCFRCCWNRRRNFFKSYTFLIKSRQSQSYCNHCIFIYFINSIFGVPGQLTKSVVFSDISNYWYLFLAVIIGGQIGNFLNLKIFPARILALVTSLLVIFVALRMGVKLFI